MISEVLTIIIILMGVSVILFSTVLMWREAFRIMQKERGWERFSMLFVVAFFTLMAITFILDFFSL